MGSQDLDGISKEFLENVLGKEVESFCVKHLADTGDNFMSILYNLDVTVVSEDKGDHKDSKKTQLLHLFSKCYPNHQGRQDFLNSSGVFWKELDFYKVWVPELLKFAKEVGVKELKLEFPTFIAGNATNADKESGNENNNNKEETKLSGPFENYVMMVDCCKTDGFKLADRLVRLDKDHLVLVMEALAKMHALSWAYKSDKKIDVIKEKFPSLQFDYANTRSVFENMMSTTFDEATQALKSNPEIDSQMLAGFVNFKQPCCTAIMEALFGEPAEPEEEMEKYFRVKPTEVPETTEVPWKVVIHGDCHMTNMLFRYNAETDKPEEVVLVDLQLSREASPIIDLIYFIYSSTYLETRQNHSDELLELYYEKFNYYCDIFKAETLPGFTLKELKRRYQRSKPIGLLVALMISVFMLKEKSDTVQMDSLEGMSQEEIMQSMTKGRNTDTRYIEHVSLLVKEFYNDGVI